MQHHGFDCLFIGADTNENAAKAERQIQQEYGISARVFGCHSQKTGLPGLLFRLLYQPAKVLHLSRDIISSYEPTHVWTESIPCAAVGRKIACQHKAVSIFDIPAIYAEEVAMRSGKGLRYQICHWIETREFRKADRLAAVSHKLKQLIHDLTGRDDVIAIPNCFNRDVFAFDEQARTRIRGEYNFDDNDRIICYAGGLSKWQRIPDILNLCHEVSKKRDNFKFIFLTQQDKRLREMLEDSNLSAERCVIRVCMPQEVPEYLSAADAGIIMRDDVPVNNVASPIKIGEYLGCGLPVILTKGIGDYSEMIRRAGVGVVLNEDDDAAEQVVRFMERPDFGTLCDKAVDLAQKNLTWNAHTENLERLFAVEHPARDD